MLITDVLKNNAELYGGDVSLVEINPELQEKNEKSWSEFELVEPDPQEPHRIELTWNEFNQKSNRLANLLQSRDIAKDKKAAILLINCLEWLPIYFGILKAGAVAVPLNFRYTSDEIKYCLELAEADVLIFGHEFIERVKKIYGLCPNIKHYIYVGEDCPDFAENYYDIISDSPVAEPCAEITEEDAAAIYFSSGTTGFPKAILLDHKALTSACYTENSNHHQTREDVFLCIPPLYHTGAKMHWFGSFLVGGRAVLLRGVKPKWIIKTISDEGVTVIFLLVPWAQDILDSIERNEICLPDYNLEQWRLMHIGAQPVPPSLIKRWLKYFPNHQYDTNYGLSESTGPGCIHLGIENIRKVGAIGIPGPNWEIKITDDKNNILNKGEIGELAIKGPGVMKCYYRDPAATEAVLKDGWLRTGDVARMDEDGFIYLVDRKKDVIISGGENLYPVQIEDFLRNHDAVKDVAIIGLPDDRLGEIAAAIIELKEGAECTEENINQFCHDLPKYKRPKKIIFDIIPRNPTGKIEKPKLRAKYKAESIVSMQTTK